MPKAKTDKLLAEWFWTDRWMGSSAFLLPIHARGLYREMLTQAWRRGAKLPQDFEQIRRAVGVTLEEWNAGWPMVSKYWRIDENQNLVNDTQLIVFAESKESADKARDRGVKGAKGRWNNSASNAQVDAQASNKHILTQCPPSPSPSPSLISVSGTGSVSEKKRSAVAPTALLSADADYATFSAAYPTSRRVGGKAARKAFINATKGRNGTHFQAMLDALEQQKHSEQWQTPKLIPLMTTWLNQERWTQVLPRALRAPHPMGRGWNCHHDPICRTTADCTKKYLAESRSRA